MLTPSHTEVIRFSAESSEELVKVINEWTKKTEIIVSNTNIIEDEDKIWIAFVWFNIYKVI